MKQEKEINLELIHQVSRTLSRLIALNFIFTSNLSSTVLLPLILVMKKLLIKQFKLQDSFKEDLEFEQVHLAPKSLNFLLEKVVMGQQGKETVQQSQERQYYSTGGEKQGLSLSGTGKTKGSHNTILIVEFLAKVKSEKFEGKKN